MAELGDARSWARDGGIGAGLLIGELLMMVILFEEGLDLPATVQQITRATNLLQGFVSAGVGAVVGALAALAVRPLVRAMFRVHPALSFLGGPIWGTLTACLSAAVALPILEGQPDLGDVNWGNLALLGTGTVILAWPVYVVLRYRGRAGWPALFVAATTQFLPLLVLFLR